MLKTLLISFSLKNTYRVNTILYSLKQVPLVKRLLPDTIYSERAFKIAANILSGIWEVISVFLGKFLYFLFLISVPESLYRTAGRAELFLHLFLFLTIIGAYMNTYLFNPTRDKYYAMILMRMDAWEYTIGDYGYSMLKTVVGFLPFTLWFGLRSGVPLPVCLLLPFSVAGLKMAAVSPSLLDYEKRGTVTNENSLGKYLWILTLVLLLAAYLIPALGYTLPEPLSLGFFLLCIPLGAAGFWIIWRFPGYRAMYQELLSRQMASVSDTQQISMELSQKYISLDRNITSRKKGFEYLNELFIRRHQKILWKSVKRIAGGCLVLLAGAMAAARLFPEAGRAVNRLLLTFLPYFVFIMYSINRGTGFTRALFMNCDHSLLTYPFYKKPEMVLKLFRIRLREIVKINLLPAAVLGGGLDFLLFASGGTDNVLNYVVIFVSIVCLSIFFSVHYLTIYYLLQPYNAGTEVKSATYQIVLSATYLACFFLMQLKMPTLVFGGVCILFCVGYSLVAGVLVYRLAPRTFRLRQ